MAPRLPLPSQKALQAAFDYNPETGELVWAQTCPERPDLAGKPAGSVNTAGDVAVGFQGKTYTCARIVWMLVHGVDPGPDRDIDHVDRDRSNLRLENLRLADGGQVMATRGLRADNKTGAKGVRFDKRRGRYEARIGYQGRRIHIGTFSTVEEAAQAYAEKAKELYGEFAHCPSPAPAGHNRHPETYD